MSKTTKIDFEEAAKSIQVKFIETNEPVLATRKEELEKLREAAKVNPSAELSKRISRYEEIIKNLESNIALTRMCMSLKRPYGM